MIFLQTTADLKDIVTTNDATVTGILIAITIAFGITIVYLYKNNQALMKDHMNELRTFNDLLLKANNSYNEFAKNLIDFKNK